MTQVMQRPQIFTSLPRERYLSDEWFQKDLDKILHKQWLYVGHQSQVANVGDYFLARVGPETLIIVRSGEDQVSALFNVCRHRGFPICENESGSAKRFACGYHSWTYGLDGGLRAVPGMPDGKFMDYTDYPLHKAHVTVWHGMIFVNLDTEEPASLTDSLAEWDPAMRQLEPENMKLAAEVTYVVQANWKLVIENFQECYHCGANHGAMCEVVDVAATFGLLSDHKASEYTVGGLPLKAGVKSLSESGEYISSKLLGEFGRGVEPPEGFTAGFMIHPMVSYALFYADHGHTQMVRPITKDTTLWTCQWFVRDDAVEGVDYKVDELTAVLDLVTQEDKDLIEKTQIGISSSRYVPGPNSAEREPGIRAALTAYRHLLGEE